jgi:Viral BACON domain
MRDEKNDQALASRVLPKPTYNNSFIFSFTAQISNPPSSEMDYLINQFGGGLYAPLTFTNFLPLNMDWHCDISKPDSGIQSFKNLVDPLVKKAKTYNVGLHLVLLYGMARKTNLYKPAKEEDIRNAQWFNDNNLAAKDKIESSGLDDFVTTSLSRYSRKVRKHLEAKVSAAFKYFKTLQQNNPDLMLITSAPGEAELNSMRTNTKPVLQEYFCDYSPFAVLEFRDWIKHEGMYGSSGKYAGEGYDKGGSRYRGSNGVKNFNTDFGTDFNTWDLKYYNWKLTDPVDSDYTDNVNKDPNIIPYSQYTFEGMMKPSIPQGFDPPRKMKKKGENRYWDLFQLFREKLVHHYVKDMASIAKVAGFDVSHYYSHQIPADYLWGTRPDDANNPLNERYYSSASPLWTANATPNSGMGITMYDVHLNNGYIRTSQYSVPVISAMSNNWGVMEYNPEVIFTGNIQDINTVENIYLQVKRLYDHNAHMISFYKWESELKYRFKGTNREKAVKTFFEAVKDKARQPIDTVFIAGLVPEFKGIYNKTRDVVSLSWSSKIWADRNRGWSDWGDFKEFVIYRGYAQTFPCDAVSQIARTKGFSFTDKTFLKAGKVYYKIAAVNGKNENGVYSEIGVSVPGSSIPVLNVSTESLHFGASTAGFVTSARKFSVTNTGNGAMSWLVQKSASWITCGPLSGVNSGTVAVTVNASGKAAGTYTGTITVSAANAVDSPHTISISLRVHRSNEIKPPFGKFATPAEGSKVSGSIPVTGWALDDIEVEMVKIYNKEGQQWRFVGDAVFVEGTRPDVEAAYKSYPFSNRAGWGYLLLTNMLPNKGNGSYQLKAIAKSSSGKETVLGIKTVIIDNDHAVKPFGTIDTPTQGGIASGSAYVNFGWALTPQPNLIPLDGSTIDVFIDGARVGSPVYNLYRKDIATLFPEYRNKDGAVGYFYINTLKYPDGMHTISWRVKDNADNTEGIGSRYFFIKNK